MPDWPLIYYVVEDDFEFLLFLSLSSAGVTVMYHHAYLMLRWMQGLLHAKQTFYKLSCILRKKYVMGKIFLMET